MSHDRRSVLELFLRQVRHPISFRELVELARVDAADEDELRTLVRSLTRTGELVRIKGGRYGLPRKMNLVVGQLRCSSKGFGFVVSERGSTPDVFVRQPNMGGALHGDEVVARIERKGKDGRCSGSIIRILKRANLRLIGKLELGAVGNAYVVPLEPRVLVDVTVTAGDTQGAREGDIVEVELLEFPSRKRDAAGRVTEVVGHTDDPGIDLELVLRRHELPTSFGPEVTQAAAAVPAEVPAEVPQGRVDYRTKVVVTIDGAKARDFDDAVGAERIPDGYRLFVHIADVAHYVRPDSVLDREAKARSTSVYFPDFVIPMLPTELSNGICSLNPKVDRLTMSLEVELDDAGTLRSYRVKEGVICSRERLTYDAVHGMLVDGDEELCRRYAEVLPSLRLLHEIATKIGVKRRERGSLDFDLPESEIVLDLQGEMTGIRRAQRLESHNLIEELMIFANETVAQHFIEQDLPFIYRVHEPPDPSRVEELNEAVLAFGLSVDALSPKSFRALLEKVRGRPEEKFVQPVALRALRLARYDSANIGHFGLASIAYTHFTSPIRRYPDLIVHRLLKTWLSAGLPDDAQREQQRVRIETIATETSRLERRAQDAEREYIERKKARFMADKVGERFAGVITAVEAFGFFVELQEFFVEGLVHLTSLHDDFYHHEQAAHRLIGENTGRVLRLGDPVEVEVGHVDLLRRRVDFLLVEAGSASARPGSRKRGSQAEDSKAEDSQAEDSQAEDSQAEDSSEQW